MSTETRDLVSRLLAAIQEREDVATAARQQALSGHWFWVVDAGSGDGDVESRKGAVVVERDLFEVGPHVALNDPASVLRLCQAHREVVDMYQVAKAQPVSRDRGKLRGLDHASAMGRLTTLGLVIKSLAAGYGIQEDK